MKLRYYKLDKNAFDPVYATKGSACFDLKAFLPNDLMVDIYTLGNKNIKVKVKENQLTLKPGDRALIPTGLIFDIPEGYSIRLHIRSSVSLKKGLMLCNSEGIVDYDYVDPTYIMIGNFSSQSVNIYNGDRIAQGELVEVKQVIMEEISEPPAQKTDRNGGFGSTGV